MLVINSADLRAARRGLERATAFHLFDPRVSLIDLGLRILEEENGQVTNEPMVRVHVRYKPRGEAFEAFAARRPEQVIDKQRIGFPVDIIEADYRLHPLPFQPLPSRAGIYNPLRGGISISNEWDFNYGTLGGKVIDRETGAGMILSAWHVLAGSTFAQPGLRIYQPGSGDRGQLRNTIARLTRHAMSAGIDAAVAELTNARPIINDQLGLGPVTGVTSPTLGMIVAKSGRSSEVTEGMIDGVDGVRTIRYGGFNRTVRHVVHILQTAGEDQVSAPGDSGSWWLEKSAHQAVGLHFAGSDVPEYGLALAMPQVIDALGVDLATS